MGITFCIFESAFGHLETSFRHYATSQNTQLALLVCSNIFRQAERTLGGVTTRCASASKRFPRSLETGLDGFARSAYNTSPY